MDLGAPPILVLVEPRDIVNIASAVRVAKNFGIESIRLVRPAVFDPWRIEGIAHNSADMIERIVMVDSLEEALADTVFSAALTARQRSAKRRTLRPRAMAEELGARSEEGAVALVVGREDAGLTNAELDCCHILVNIPTNPEYRSLNLAQAVAIASYETWIQRTTGGQPLKAPRHVTDRATAEQLERTFEDWERALWALEFFKTRQPDHVMRSVREVVYRAAPDGREAALLRAMQIELVRYLGRVGAPVGARPGEAEREGTPVS